MKVFFPLQGGLQHVDDGKSDIGISRGRDSVKVDVFLLLSIGFASPALIRLCFVGESRSASQYQ